MQGLAHEGRARRALVLLLSCAAAETFKIRAEPFYGDSRGNFPRGSLRLRHRAFPAGAESFGFLKNGFGNRVFSPSHSWRKPSMHVRRNCSHSRRSCSHSSLKAARAAALEPENLAPRNKARLHHKGALAGASKKRFRQRQISARNYFNSDEIYFFPSRTSTLAQNPSATEVGWIFSEMLSRRATGYGLPRGAFTASGERDGYRGCRSSEFKVDNSSDFAEN